MKKLLLSSNVPVFLMFCLLVSPTCRTSGVTGEKPATGREFTCNEEIGNADQTVVVRCGKASVDKDQVCVSPGFSVIWDLSNVPKETTVRIGSFVRKSGKGESDPIESWSYDAGNQSQMKAKVKTGAEGTYKYTITCGRDDILDPIIDVPPRP